MNLAAMLDKDKWTRKRNEVLCSVAGGGYHDKDASSPQNQGMPSLHDHIVVFGCEFEHVFVAESAKVAHAAIKVYAEANPVNAAPSPDLRTLAKTAAEYADEELDDDGCLVIRGVQWNAIQEVLSLSGVGVTSTDDKPFPKDDPILKIFQS